MTYKTVLFDMDGTLLDSLSDMHDAVNHILAENGWEARSREEIRAFVGNGARKLMERAIPETLAPQRFEAVLADYKDWYQAHNCVKTQPYPGISHVLAELEARGVKTAVAVYVGDSEVDVATAWNAGLPMIGVSWGFRGREGLAEAGAEVIVDTAGELLERLLEA